MFALPERNVGDLAKEAGLMVKGADMAPVDLVGVGLKVIVAQCLQALEHWIVLELGCPESDESLGVVGGGGLGAVSGGELHRSGVITFASVGRLVLKNHSRVSYLRF